MCAHLRQFAPKSGSLRAHLIKFHRKEVGTHILQQRLPELGAVKVANACQTCGANISQAN